MNVEPWVREACLWPLAFAQVREDPLLDQRLADLLAPGGSALMVASGGCTAAWLARHPYLRALTLVDINAAQLALCRLKRHLLTHYQPAQRTAILGHAAMSARQREQHLQACFDALHLACDVLGPLNAMAEAGPDYCGRYECLFAALQAKVRADECLDAQVSELLVCTEVDAQRRWLAAQPGVWARLCGIIEDVFALHNLVALFGAGATQNRRRDFAQHFIDQLHWVLTHLPTATNPYLWQFLRGRHAPAVVAPWLALPAGIVDADWRYLQATMLDALNECASNGVRHDLLHLSNVLDWVADDEALATLGAAWHSAKPGARLIVRQLNSRLDLPLLGARAGWRHDDALSERLRQSDRSFFYRRIYVATRD